MRYALVLRSLLQVAQGQLDEIEVGHVVDAVRPHPVDPLGGDSMQPPCVGRLVVTTVVICSADHYCCHADDQSHHTGLPSPQTCILREEGVYHRCDDNG